MSYLLLGAVALLGFANGANDNFKGVATLWGAGRTSYRRALAWATAFTFLGSLGAIQLAGGLAAKFNGSGLVGAEIHAQEPFLAAVALGAAGTVLVAARVGLPISTTHALTGALAGAGLVAAGFAHAEFGDLGKRVMLPLLFSPAVSLLLTVTIYPLVIQAAKLAGNRDCVCLDAPQPLAEIPDGVFTAAAVPVPAAIRVANAEDCQTGTEVVRWSASDALHWLSGAAISFARGVNDTPKIAGVLLMARSARVEIDYALVATAMAAGGVLGAARVAQTLGKRITPMTTQEAVVGNLVAATLVGLASGFALPVSTTHVTSGSIFGIGLLRRRDADWGRVRDIVLSWVATLPMGAVLAVAFYYLLSNS
jgi:PiT family inorganic phosphate transporter